MAKPVYTLPRTGSAPKLTTAEQHEAAINDVVSDLYDLWVAGTAPGALDIAQDAIDARDDAEGFRDQIVTQLLTGKTTAYPGPHLRLSDIPGPHRGATTLTVCLIGDSTTGPTPQYSWSAAQTMPGMIEQALKAANPGVTVNMVNLFWDGRRTSNLRQTISAIMGGGAAAPTWAYTGGNTWLAHAQAVNPDILIINTGTIGHQEVQHLHAHIVGGPDPVGPMLKRI